MEGLKLIAQSTFDKHQKFRSSSAAATATGTTGEAAYRYNVIEIGAFGGASNNNITSSSTAAKRQSIGSVQSVSSSGRQNGSSKISLNEWMVFEDDLGSFMKKRPIDFVPAASSSAFGGELEKPKSIAQSNTTVSSAPSKSTSVPSSSKATANSTTAATVATTATSATSTGAPSDRLRKDRAREEVEAVASLKLVCIPRASVDDDAENPDAASNTLAIARETFLRLYVDHMDADHCALYYLAREYDGYHEFTDTPKGVVTKFVGTSEYALLWTFNRRTLETRGLFLDRCQRWRSSDASAAATAAHAANHDGGGGSEPVTPVKKLSGHADGSAPSTPSKRWTKRQTGTVSASEAWSAFRETLNIYRRYLFAPQVLSFVCCVQMLRSFDDQTSEEDLPRLKEIETGIETASSDGGGIEATSRAGPPTSVLPTQTSSFAVVTDQNPFGPSTPPGDDEKLVIPTTQPAGLTGDKLASHSVAVSRVDTSLANKLRHLKMARSILDVLARDKETLTVDVVAPAFLDRYHWAMEGMTEAIPALERHISTLEEYLRYLKGRSERLSGLVRSLTIISLSATTISRTQSDALSLRCNEADSRSDRSLGGPVAFHNGGGGGDDDDRPDIGAAIPALHADRRRFDHDDRRGDDGGTGGQHHGNKLGFYAGYLFRGNYSHRLA